MSTWHDLVSSQPEDTQLVWVRRAPGDSPPLPSNWDAAHARFLCGPEAWVSRGARRRARSDAPYHLDRPLTIPVENTLALPTAGRKLSAMPLDLQSRPNCGYVGGPRPWRGLAVIAGLALLTWALASRVETGADAMVQQLGRLEVTARLVERPDQFPQLGAYRYTYVLKYKVLSVHRQDSAGKYPLKAGEEVFVGHYKPWLPRSQIKDADWGDSPLGGTLDQFVAGEVHRLALDYELQNLAPSGALDYCFPPVTNRFFAVWANRTTY